MIKDIVKQTQNRLMAIYGRKHYYTTAYVLHEKDYWGQIPQWLETDLVHTAKTRTSSDGFVGTLDIGPGWGTLSCVVSQLYEGLSRGLALDRVVMMDRAISREYNFTYSMVDIERERCPKAPYGWDIVIMTEVLEHFNFNPVGTLQKIKEEMSPYGRLYLSTPDAKAKWGKVALYDSWKLIPAFDSLKHSFDDPQWMDGHVYQYDKDELAQVFDLAGFKVIRQDTSLSMGGGHLTYTLAPV